MARKPNNKAPLVYINGAAAYENEINGFPTKVLTWGHPLSWHKQVCNKDTSPSADKRDRFDKRNALCYSVAEVGEFEWAIAFAPSLDAAAAQAAGTVVRKRPVNCAFCNAQHNWCAFYRRADNGQYLGHSGCDCFAAVVANLKLDNAEAVLRAAKEERSRSERFRKTMEKVNDFKRDFPALYENREWLDGHLNPFQPLWRNAMRQLDRAEGVDEKFFEDCLAGKFDYRRSHYRSTDASLRRTPEYLKWASRLAQQTIGDFSSVRSESLEAAYKEPTYSQFRREPPIGHPLRNAPRPTAPAAPLVPVPLPQTANQLQADGQFLVANGYAWSWMAQSAATGSPLKGGPAAWVKKTADAVRAKKLDPVASEPVEGAAPKIEGIEVGDGDGV